MIWKPFDEARRYLKLTPSKTEGVKKVAKRSGMLDREEYITIFEECGIRKGRKLARQVARQECLDQGIIRGKREALLHRLRRSFDGLPGEVIAPVERIESPTEFGFMGRHGARCPLIGGDWHDG